MFCEILATGSPSNCTLLNDGMVAVDCGVPFSVLRERHKKLQVVILTHEHGDHFNGATIKRLAVERPSLRFCSPEWLVPELSKLVDKQNIDIIGMGDTMDYGLFSVKAFSLIHDVPNAGYLITFDPKSSIKTVFYATDCNSLEGIDAKCCDLYLIEGNYSAADILERIRQKYDAGEYVYEWRVIKNHLSVEKAELFIANNAGPNSKYILMHGHVD